MTAEMSDNNKTVHDHTPANPSERRRVVRTQVDAPAVFQVLSEDGKGKKEDGRLLDLSIAGAAFSTSRELASGSVLSLRIPAADTSGSASSKSPSQSFQVKGTIVNRQELAAGHWRFGVKFDTLYYTLAKRAIALAVDQTVSEPEDFSANASTIESECISESKTNS